MFESIGPLNASKIVRDRNTSYSYGFGFVDFVSAADAVRAVETLNGLQLQNKNIKVAYARTGDNIKGGNLYVRNVPVDMSEKQVQEIFTPFGVVVQCRVLIDQATGRSKGVCFVLFETRSQAEEAITSLNGHVLEGSCSEPLKVQFAEDNKGKPRPPGEAMGGRGSFMPVVVVVLVVVAHTRVVVVALEVFVEVVDTVRHPVVVAATVRHTTEEAWVRQQLRREWVRQQLRQWVRQLRERVRPDAYTDPESLPLQPDEWGRRWWWRRCELQRWQWLHELQQRKRC